MFRDLLRTRKAFANVLLWQIVSEVKAGRLPRLQVFITYFLLRMGCFFQAGSASAFAQKLADSISQIDPQMFICSYCACGTSGWDATIL